jgi:mono/diheme cytochrome c family protein
MLTPPITDASTQPVLPDPFDSSAPLGERARAYLHSNCSQCHRPGGPTPTNLDLRYTTSLAGTHACDVLPQSGDLGLGTDARIIAPGSSINSLMTHRMNRRDSAAMPPLASASVDTQGVSLVAQWIDSLTACQ